MRYIEDVIILAYAVEVVPFRMHVRIAYLAVIVVGKPFGQTDVSAESITVAVVIHEGPAGDGLYDLIIEMFEPAFGCQLEVRRKIKFMTKDELDGALAFEGLKGRLAGDVGIGGITKINTGCEINALPGVHGDAA